MKGRQGERTRGTVALPSRSENGGVEEDEGGSLRWKMQDSYRGHCSTLPVRQRREADWVNGRLTGSQP